MDSLYVFAGIGICTSLYVIGRLLGFWVDSLEKKATSKWVIKTILGFAMVFSVCGLPATAFFTLFEHWLTTPPLQERDKYKSWLEIQEKENEKLRSEIAKMKSEQGEHNSSTASSSSSSDREPTYLMEAANGMTVRVPESKLDEWIKAQKELMESHTRSASDKKMHDDIVREFFGDES